MSSVKQEEGKCFESRFDRSSLVQFGNLFGKRIIIRKWGKKVNVRFKELRRKRKVVANAVPDRAYHSAEFIDGKDDADLSLEESLNLTPTHYSVNHFFSMTHALLIAPQSGRKSNSWMHLSASCGGSLWGAPEPERGFKSYTR